MMSDNPEIPHWPGCPRRLVLARTHPSGARTVTCWTCSAQITLSPNGRVVSTFTPDQPPMWARIPEEIR